MKNTRLITLLGVATSFLSGLAAIQWDAIGETGKTIAIILTIAGAVVAAFGKALGDFQ